MKKILTILTLFAALTLLSSSCQKELPDEFKDLVVNKGEQEQTPTTPKYQNIMTFTVNGVSFKMVLVDGSTFTMGATLEQGEDTDDSEKPTHSVTLSTYYIGETEVTQELWQAVMGSNPSYYSGSQKPVEQVSWYDCLDFITRLNSLTGENFRLPTEAEWEFAARGGKNRRGYKYSGSNKLNDVAWYSENSNSETHNVAQKSPNELGLYDMSGNVWEWCLDWYGWYRYSSSRQTNPTGPSCGTDRVLRGGSWSGSAWDCRVSRRTSHAFWLDYEGLRLALPTVENNRTLEVDKNNLSFPSVEDSKTLTINSNTNWSITSDQSWCKVNPFSGYYNETITVNVTGNNSTDSRSATITVKADNITQNISVTQAGATPEDQSIRTFTVNGVSFKMIRVNGGTFTMGATSEQGDDAEDEEKPMHNVTLSTYFVGETEVTQELWQAVMNYNPSHFIGIRRPVENVSWDDCQDFVTKLSSLTGENFRMPTEAEWEYAARGGNNSQGYKYSGSNTIENVAWYYENSYGAPHNVAQKLPNELGLYDMSGNVNEWCQDWYGNYSSRSQTNPTGPESGSYRVVRGSCWYHSAKSCRVSFRGNYKPNSRESTLGLRLAF